LVFLRRNHQREEIDGQKSVGRISETPPAVKSAREVREVTTAFGAQALGIMSHWIIKQLPINRLFDRSCAEFKFFVSRVETPRSIGILRHRSSGNRESRVLSLKFCPHVATRTPHRQNRKEFIHGTRLIPQHSKRVKTIQNGQKSARHFTSSGRVRVCV
jgi:hypothetical protein